MSDFVLKVHIFQPGYASCTFMTLVAVWLWFRPVIVQGKNGSTCHPSSLLVRFFYG